MFFITRGGISWGQSILLVFKRKKCSDKDTMKNIISNDIINLVEIPLNKEWFLVNAYETENPGLQYQAKTIKKSLYKKTMFKRYLMATNCFLQY